MLFKINACTRLLLKTYLLQKKYISLKTKIIYTPIVQKNFHWPTILIIPGKERILLRFCTDSLAYHPKELPIEHATQPELMQHNCVLVRRGIG